MVKSLCLDKNGVKKGAWSEEEDDKLRAYIQRYGHWNWRLLPKFACLPRTGKSCRLRWMNYLRPNMKHGNFTKEEDNMIVDLHKKLGNKWSAIAAKLSGRSDNEIKNRWNTQLKKRAHDNNNMLESEHHKTIEPNQANPKENPDQKLQKDESTNLASESSSPSSIVTELSSYWLSGSCCADSSDIASQISNYQFANDFWTQPFSEDITSLVDSISSPYVADNLICQTSCHDMTTTDELSWSMLDSYIEYNDFINCWETW